MSGQIEGQKGKDGKGRIKNLFPLSVTATGLKLLRIKVPAYSLTGKSALLECSCSWELGSYLYGDGDGDGDSSTGANGGGSSTLAIQPTPADAPLGYDLETDKLYSITWYKDHEEFYRYVPRGEPTKHSYRVEGVKVDHRQSDQQQVLLQDVSLHSSGKYKCEVSAEAPSFNSVSAEANMEVVVLPQDGPSITGEEKVYATGDVLGLNCTSDKSRPAATLKWFINGHQVKPDTEMMFEQHGLSSVISSLRLQLEPDHIADDKINVRHPHDSSPTLDSSHCQSRQASSSRVALGSLFLLDSMRGSSTLVVRDWGMGLQLDGHSVYGQTTWDD
ncbi:hypothetical protein WN48_05285 [Eufriesea mexicana]|uniref:Ig-like domain-containing protein n=1 Tax=Eufriesea mexicana TaxID=516756 RepID=A0A310SUD5_9HYME|nr:hypothetical protein WN48_05285 [Eufriesea mexicana]